MQVLQIKNVNDINNLNLEDTSQFHGIDLNASFNHLSQKSNLKNHFMLNNFIKLPYSETWGVWMKKESELAKYQFIQPHHLRNKPVIISSQDTIKNEIAGWIGDNDRKFRVVASYNLIYNALLMAEEDIGYVIGFESIYSSSAESTLCFRPLSPKLTTYMNVIWKKYQVFPQLIEVFLQMLKEEMK